MYIGHVGKVVGGEGEKHKHETQVGRNKGGQCFFIYIFHHVSQQDHEEARSILRSGLTRDGDGG